MNNVFYAYLAGLIDGEGCFLLFKHSNKKLKKGYHWQSTLTITQNNREFLESIINELGCGYISTMTKKDTFGRRVIYGYFMSLSGNHLREILPIIIPYLRRKRKQAELLLEALTLISNAYTKRPYRRSVELNEKIETLALKISNLKKE